MSSPKSAPQQHSLMNRIASGLLWGQVLRIIEIATSLIFLIVVVRKLGPQQYGLFALISNIGGVGVVITGLGFSETLSKHLPQISTENGRAAAFFAARRVLSAYGLLVIGYCAVLWVFRNQIARQLSCTEVLPYWPLVLGFFTSQSLYLAMSMVNVGMMRLRLVCAAGSVMNVLSLVGAIIGLSLRGPSAATVCWASVLGFTASALVFALSTRELFGHAKDRTDMAPMWKFSNRVWLAKLAMYAVSGEMMVLLMAWWIGDSKEIGYFNSAFMPIRRLQILLLGWTLPVLPSLSELFAVRGADGVSSAYRCYMKILIGIVVPVCAFVAVYADRIISLMFTNAFLPAAQPLRVYSIMWLCSAMLGSGLATSVLYSLNRAKTAAVIRVVVAIASFVAAYFLIAAFKSFGAVLAVGITLLLTAVLDLAALSRVVRLRLPWAYMGKALLSSGIAMGLSLILKPTALWSLLACGFIYIAGYGAIMSRLRPLEMNEKDMLRKYPRLARILAYL